MALNYVTLTGTYADGEGIGIDGTRHDAFLTLTPTASLTDATNDREVRLTPVRVPLNADGTFSARLLATDNSTLMPSGWAWQVTETLPGLTDFTWNFFLAFATGVTQDVATLSPVSSVTTMQAYLPVPTGAVSAGLVPIATGSGEQSAWGSPGAASLPLTTLGDLLYEDATPAPARLPGNVSATRKFLRQLGNGVLSAVPVWDTLLAADVPLLNQNTTGTAANITGTLDQVPAPAAAVGLNSKKITSLANGTAAQDAAAFGQLPVADATAADITPVGTVAVAGAIGKWADAGHVHADPNPLPGDFGWVAWTTDPITAQSNTNVLAPGSMYLVAFWVRKTQTLSNLIYHVTTAGGTLTSGQNFCAIFSADGTQRAISADQSVPWVSSGIKTTAMTVPYSAPPGMYWAAFLANGTTGPTLRATANVSSTMISNAGLAAASLRVAINGTALTAIPGSITPSANITTNAAPLVVLVS